MAFEPRPFIFPAHRFNPDPVKADVQVRTIQGGTSLAGETDVIATDGGGRWEITYFDLDLDSPALQRLLASWNSFMAGGAKSFLVPLLSIDTAPRPLSGGEATDPGAFAVDDDRFPLEVGYVTPHIVAEVAADAALRATTLRILVTTGSEIEGGEKFSIGTRGYKVERVLSRSGMTATCLITPPLRLAVSQGDAVNFDWPVTRCHLVPGQDISPEISLGLYGSIGISFEEDFSPDGVNDLDVDFILGLDFAASQYRFGGDYTEDVTEISGYAYTRTGTKQEFSSDNALVTYAANVPAIIDDRGYWSRVAHTNVVTYSQQLDNVAWTKGDVTVVPNAVAGPASYPSGDTINEGTTTAIHLISSGGTHNYTNGENYTRWCIAKAGTGSLLQIAFGNANFGGDAWADYNLTTGVVHEAAAATAGMEDLGNGLWKCWLTATATAGGSSTGISIVFPQTFGGGRLPSFTGTSRTFHVFHAQAVDGSDPGPVIVTTSAAVTVGADSLVFDTPITADEPFLFWATGTFDHAVDVANEYLAALSDGTTSNFLGLARMPTTTSGAEPGYAAARARSGGPPVFEGYIGDAPVTGSVTIMGGRTADGQYIAALRDADGFIWIEPELTAAFPETLDRLEIGFAGGAATVAPDAPIDSVYLRRGAFSYEDIIEMLGGYEGTPRFQVVERSPEGIGGHQGVAATVSHIFATGTASDQFVLKKYDRDWNLIWSVDTEAYGSGLHEQVNGIYPDEAAGKLYVCGNNYNTTPAKGFVFEIDIDDGSFIAEHILPGNRWTEAIERWNGSWWEVNATAHEIRQLSLDFSTVTATHALPDASPGLLFWQAIFRSSDGKWFLNHHDEVERRLRAYTFDGANFISDPTTYHPPSFWATQSARPDPDGEHVWWNERISSTSAIRLVKTTI